MGLSNCPECGKLYMENAMKLCPECCKVYDEQVEKVLNHLKTVASATVNEISAATGVKTQIILKLMHKGFLMGSNCQITYPCETCGKPIEQGRFCKKCSKTFATPNSQYKAPETKFSEKSKSKWYLD